jgi:hypothetical protein
VKMKPLSECMLDNKLFGRAFGGETFAAWRTVAKILEGAPLKRAELDLYRQFTGRDKPPSAPFSEAYLIKPRRAGGTLFSASVGLHAALQDYRKRLGPGEMATVALIATDRKQARQLVNYVVGLIDDSPAIAAEVSDRTKETITFKHRVQLEVHTGSFRSTRGYSYAAVILDELAFMRDEFSATPDVELVRAVRPGLANLGGLLIGLSSPHTRRGHLYSMFQQHYGKESDVLVIQAGGPVLNPTIKQAVIDRARAEDPIAARSEWDAQFREDISQWLADELIEAAREGRTGGTKRAPVAFVDMSGGRHDASCLGIAHAEGEPSDQAPPRLVLDVLEHVKAPHEPSVVVERFCRILKDYKIRKVAGDRYAAEWCASAFKNRGISYEPSELNKSEIYMEVLAGFSERRITLIDDKRLITELRMLERKPRTGGKPDTVDHAPNMHDDAANAACGALWLANASKGGVSMFSPGVSEAMTRAFGGIQVSQFPMPRGRGGFL